MSSVRESRRSDIMQAALREFCAKGIEAVSMSEIARRAQIGKSTIYEYFPSKERLLLETSQMLLDRLLEELETVFSEAQTFREKLIRYYEAVNRLVERLGMNLPIILTSQPITGVLIECVDAFRRTLFQKIVREFRAAQERGELNASLDAEVAATLLTTQITPLLLRSMNRFEIEDAAGVIVDILMYGLAAPAGADAAAFEKRRGEGAERGEASRCEAP